MTTEPTFTESEMAAVKKWNATINSDYEKWKADFDRMRENMDFASGLQWEGQKEIKDDRYVCNVTLKEIRQKVATLYAKDPTAEAISRPRRYFQVWDGDAMSLLEAQQRRQMALMSGTIDLEAEVIMADFMRGKEEQELVDKICDTLQKTYSYQVDTAQPTFKRQMKALVTRTITCGVGYLRLRLIREDDSTPSSIPGNTSADRARYLQETMLRMEDEGFNPTDIDPTDPRAEAIKSLALSLGVSAMTGDDYVLPERIEFDFLPSTSVIPDRGCRQLTEFVAARHVTIEYELPTDEVNAMFGVEVKPSTKINDKEGEQTISDAASESSERSMTTVREVLNFRDKTHFYICQGYKGYLRAPESLEPCVSGFWHLFALTFNDVETDGKDETRTSPFPPSDVDLVRHPQKEWNRTRDTLRSVRNACSPKWAVRKGTISKEDQKKIANALPNEVIELEVPVDVKLNDVFIAVPTQVPQPEVFSTEPLVQDLMMGGGIQEANLGNAQPNVTATVGTIAEQSRLTVSASNVDDLDDFLSLVARAAGQMILSPQGFSRDTVMRIVGPGAVWPENSRQDYINLIFLKIKAASSGRPNKALDIANYERVAAHLIAAGANPFGVIEEGVRRLGDEQLDVTKFLPIMGMGQPATQTSPPQQPLQPGLQQPLPLAAS